MTDFLISEELRDSLIGLLMLLEKESEKSYHKYSDKYSNRLLLANGRIVNLPFLADLQEDLENLEELIEESEYDSKAEELLYVARELKML